MAKIVHPSELPRYTQAIWKGPMGKRARGGGETAIDKPERPCSRCGKQFKPTVRRRMLCASCFGNAD